VLLSGVRNLMADNGSQRIGCIGNTRESFKTAILPPGFAEALMESSSNTTTSQSTL
jgi:hypothetical protein